MASSKKDPSTSDDPVTAAASKAANDLVRRPRGTPRPMPADYSISLDMKGSTDKWLMNPGGKRLHPMRGFEDQYTDIIDYILRITHTIWEEKDMGYIYDTYSHNAHVTDDFGLQYGRDKIVADTVHTINAFPDIRLYADDVIWAGNDEVGFYTSHRTVILGHNTGYSKYGPPTGKKVVFWCIANCLAIENEIFEEWVLYNNSAYLAQLGFDLPQLARRMAAQVDWRGFEDLRSGEAARLLGQGKPPLKPYIPSSAEPIEIFLREMLHQVWNWRKLGIIHQAYAPTLRFFGPTNRSFYGLGEYQSFVLSLLALFPDLTFQVDDIYWMGNEKEGYRTSTRWSIVGTHRGAGVYGAPTGRHVYLWGITQHLIRDGKIHEEWMLFNEFELMQQIYRE